MDRQALDYNSLSKSGLQLSENYVKLVIDSLVSGAEDAKKYLNIPADDSWPQFNFSNDAHTLGYSSKDDAICISLNHLNQAGARSTQLEFKDQLLLFIPDVFYIIVKYTYWLRLLGREATIHRYQKAGNPQLHAQFPTNLSVPLSTRQLLLSNIEVEARTIVDEIIQQNGENSIWKKVNSYFSEKYPQHFNKSIDELIKLPKPEFPMSFEMEFYMV